jgi:hypothetical protein
MQQNGEAMKAANSTNVTSNMKIRGKHINWDELNNTAQQQLGATFKAVHIYESRKVGDIPVPLWQTTMAALAQRCHKYPVSIKNVTGQHTHVFSLNGFLTSYILNLW